MPTHFSFLILSQSGYLCLLFMSVCPFSSVSLSACFSLSLSLSISLYLSLSFSCTVSPFLSNSIYRSLSHPLSVSHSPSPLPLGIFRLLHIRRGTSVLVCQIHSTYSSTGTCSRNSSSSSSYRSTSISSTSGNNSSSSVVNAFAVVQVVSLLLKLF